LNQVVLALFSGLAPEFLGASGHSFSFQSVIIHLHNYERSTLLQV
jgi:hypothetical protein